MLSLADGGWEAEDRLDSRAASLKSLNKSQSFLVIESLLKSFCAVALHGTGLWIPFRTIHPNAFGLLVNQLYIVTKASSIAAFNSNPQTHNLLLPVLPVPVLVRPEALLEEGEPDATAEDGDDDAEGGRDGHLDVVELEAHLDAHEGEDEGDGLVDGYM